MPFVREPPDPRDFTNGETPPPECRKLAAGVKAFFDATLKQLTEDFSTASGTNFKDFEEVAESLANRNRDMAIVGLVGLGVGGGLSYVISKSQKYNQRRLRR